ncbi:MAG: hypothetical protein IKO07_00670 [Clostridia bacterium]|nr:hypothetical protein [Clostridia bacterium]
MLWPVDLSVMGYQKVFENHRVWIGYKNTLIYTTVGTFINVAMTLICAYPLARRRLPHKGFFTFLISFTMLFNGGMIPTYPNVYFSLERGMQRCYTIHQSKSTGIQHSREHFMCRLPD